MHSGLATRHLIDRKGLVWQGGAPQIVILSAYLVIVSAYFVILSAYFVILSEAKDPLGHCCKIKLDPSLRSG
jgi:hypothetical protein